MPGDLPDGSAQDQHFNWLQRMFLRFGAKRQGDVVITQIGPNATDVVVGKNIIQIGTLNVPVWFLSLIAIVISASVVTGAYVSVVMLNNIQSIRQSVEASHIVTPKMSGDFNIAVAEFGKLYDHDKVAESEEGLNLSKQVYTSVNQAVDDLRQAGFEIQVYSPITTGVVSGANADEISENAAKVAEKLQADLLIYGVWRFEGGKSILEPSFYLANSKLVNAQELAGSGAHRYGEIAVDGDIEKNVVSRKEMRDRTSGFSGEAGGLGNLVVALGYFALGRYDQADSYLEKSIQLGQLQDSTKKVVYLFLGSIGGLRRDLGGAKEYYKKALALDSNYDRALFGSAQIDFLQAQNGCEAGKVDKEGILSAMAGYTKAEREATDYTEISRRARFGTARAYLCLAIAEPEKADYWDEAKGAYTELVDDYKQDQNPRLRSAAAEASADLGLMYVQQTAMMTETNTDTETVYNSAVDAYQWAAEQSDQKDRQATFYLWLGYLYAVQQKCDSARAAIVSADTAYQEFRSVNPKIERKDVEAFRGTVQELIDESCASSTQK